MEKQIKITQDYLYIPVQTEAPETWVEIYVKEDNGTCKKEMEFLIPVGTGEDSSYTGDYTVRFPVKKFTDKTIIMKGDVPEAFFREIKQDSWKEYEALERPSIHFTPQRSWINDPNGLCYHNGEYHLYYQFNPFHTKWNNMSWGHAVSKDLHNWEELDPVLFSDEEGMMFSGSAIVNTRECLDLPKDALLYFYTAAGGITPWSKDKLSVQKMAYSLDQGRTLIKTERGKLPTIEKENRDPKVFWHEETQAYIMCLWLEGNEFGIFRAETKELDFHLTHRFSLDEAWECPDLFPLKNQAGEDVWVFWTADGFYYFGWFDGYQFLTHGKQHKAYMNKAPYAAQTISGVWDNRVISIPWLRLQFPERLYTGAMGVPRELSLVEKDGKMKISQKYTREFWNMLEPMDIQKEEMSDQSVEVELGRPTLAVFSTGNLMLNLDGTGISYDGESGKFTFGEETFFIGTGVEDFSILIDDVICEVTANHGIITAAFELHKKPAFLRFLQGNYRVEEVYGIR